MATTSPYDRATHVLALMKAGDDAFNRQDIAGMKAAHHPDMIAYVTGNEAPLRGRAAHTAAMQAMFRAFPDVHVQNDPYPIQFGSGDWMTVVCKATGTFSGKMVLPDGKTIPGTGKSFDLDFATTAKWEGEFAARRTCLLGLSPYGAADRTGLRASTGRSDPRLRGAYQ